MSEVVDAINSINDLSYSTLHADQFRSRNSEKKKHKQLTIKLFSVACAHHNQNKIIRQKVQFNVKTINNYHNQYEINNLIKNANEN